MDLGTGHKRFLRAGTAWIDTLHTVFRCLQQQPCDLGANPILLMGKQT